MSGTPGSTPARARRPLHTRPGPIAVVIVGGAVGTAAREALTLAIPDLAGLPLALLACNLAGALLLGLLLESLTRLGGDEGARRTLRLLAGTGFLGGFTSYSALSVAVAGGFTPGTPGAAAAVGYGLVTILAGALATAAGIALGARTRRQGRGAPR